MSDGEFRPAAKDIAYSPVLAVFTTTERNNLSSAGGLRAGFICFDNTLHYAVTWDGAAWRNGAGTSV